MHFVCVSLGLCTDDVSRALSNPVLKVLQERLLHSGLHFIALLLDPFAFELDPFVM